MAGAGGIVGKDRNISDSEIIQILGVVSAR